LQDSPREIFNTLGEVFVAGLSTLTANDAPEVETTGSLETIDSPV